MEIFEGCVIKGMNVVMRYGGSNRIEIGEHTTVGGSLGIECSEGTRLTIGKDCMFSHHIRIFTTDMHAILDKDGSRINKGKDVIIGDHVWIGYSAMILKGAKVPDGSIIGARTVYSIYSNDANCIFAGNPAKKIKENIVWNRDLL